MIFGEVPVAEAVGAMLAHSVRAGDLKLQKGRTLTAEDAGALSAAGVARVTVARPESSDMGEDEAAAFVAEALAGENLSLSAPFTGRANLFAEVAGVLRVDAARIGAANAVDEAITVATLPDFARVRRRQMLATVKIIPYAAPAAAVEAARAALGGGAVTLHPFRMRRAALFLTETPGMKRGLLDKGAAAIEARLSALGIEMTPPVTVPHEIAPLAAALRDAAGDMVLILGGSATSDRRDTAPAAVEAAGGALGRFGMPVDPGNLLFTATLNGRPVLGLPGCARSPKLNGADWVLERMAAGLEVTGEDIAAMGVGGLLKEIPSRPQPRGGAPAPGRPLVSAILLAAGASSRMGGEDKLTRDAGGAPLLRRTAERLAASSADEVIVVLRPGDKTRRAALKGLRLRLVENPLAEEGMGASIRAGMAAIAPEAEAALIALADMPDLAARDYDRLIAAYDAEEGREIIRAADAEGRPGNPVLFGRRFFEPLAALEGDEGARGVLAAHGDLVRTVAIGAAARADLDTPEDWAEWEGEA